MRSFGSWRITDLLLVDGYADGVNVGLGIGVEALFGEPPDGLELTFLDCASQRLQTAARDGNRANREMNLQPLRWRIGFVLQSGIGRGFRIEVLGVAKHVLPLIVGGHAKGDEIDGFGFKTVGLFKPLRSCKSFSSCGDVHRFVCVFVVW